MSMSRETITRTPIEVDDDFQKALDGAIDQNNKAVKDMMNVYSKEMDYALSVPAVPDTGMLLTLPTQ